MGALPDAQARFSRHQLLVAGNQIILPFLRTHVVVSVREPYCAVAGCTSNSKVQVRCEVATPGFW